MKNRRKEGNEPVQLRPSPENPALQVHLKDPAELAHVAFGWQTPDVEHSFISMRSLAWERGKIGIIENSEG